jgi:hypothetical protein
MRQFVLAVLLVGLLHDVGYAWQRANTNQEASACAVVDDALTSYYKLKVGMTRKELEQTFTHDGGLSTRWSSTYVYRKCHNIKVNVDFVLDPNVKNGSESASDQIKTLSRLFLDYESKD